MGSIFGVAGNPIFHSKSPLMFNTAFHELAMDSIYVRCAAESAEELITMARQIGMDGFNVTAPFKEDIIPHLDEVEGEARKIGAVNTVVGKD